MNYGRYQIIREIGRGSMGVVYEAQDPTIGRVVALKVLRQDRITTESFEKRFLKEAKANGRLAHHNIVTIYDVGEDQGTVYIAMEYLEGIPLSDLIKNKRLEIPEVIGIGVQIAEALDYAHHKGVFHRDIKPSNIIVEPDSWIKITDFGIAHIEDSSSTVQTQVGDIMGTPAYMSPEQIQGQPIDGRTDIFSLGVILYEMTTGHRPFGKGKSLATMFNEIIHQTPEEPLRSSPEVPQRLSKVIMKALSKDPAARFQSGKEMADALHQALSVEQPDNPRLAPQPPLKRYGKLFVGIVVVASIAAGIFFIVQDRKFPPHNKPLQKPVTQPGASQGVPPPSPAVTTSDKMTGSKQIPEKSIKAPAPRPVSPPIRPTPTPAKVSSPEPVAPTSSGTKAVQPQVLLPAPTVAKSLPLPKFALLKLKTVPAGADVYINGDKKGTSPLTLKLGLGKYKVGISSPGYLESEQTVKLERMTVYPVTVTLKPNK